MYLPQYVQVHTVLYLSSSDLSRLAGRLDTSACAASAQTNKAVVAVEGVFDHMTDSVEDCATLST